MRNDNILKWFFLETSVQGYVKIKVWITISIFYNYWSVFPTLFNFAIFSLIMRLDPARAQLCEIAPGHNIRSPVILILAMALDVTLAHSSKIKCWCNQTGINLTCMHGALQRFWATGNMVWKCGNRPFSKRQQATEIIRKIAAIWWQQQTACSITKPTYNFKILLKSDSNI